MKSLSEIETISKRASRAAGFSWGIAEEIGKSVRLLELFGLPGIKNLNQYFQEINLKKFENLKIINKINKSTNLGFCPISLGVSFIDQVKTLENYKKCEFSEVRYPFLLLPFLSRGSEIIGKRILFRFANNQFLLNFNVSISSNFLQDNFLNTAKDIKISFLENKDNFEDLEWKKLYQLSEKTFVEETQSLKEGAAGAGLTDND